MVEHRQVLGFEKGGLGHRRRGPVCHGEMLEMASGLVAEVADRATMEARKSGHRRDRLARHLHKRRQRVPVAEVELDRPRPDERVAGETLATLHALQQESWLGGRAQQRVSTDRSEHVGEDFAVHGHQRVVRGQGPSFRRAGSALSHLCLASLFSS